MARSFRNPTKAPPKTPAKNRRRRAPGKGSGKAAPESETPTGRVAQVRAVWKMTREQDPKAIPLILGPALGGLVVLVVVGILTSHIVLFSVIGVLVAR